LDLRDVEIEPPLDEECRGACRDRLARMVVPVMRPAGDGAEERARTRVGADVDGVVQRYVIPAPSGTGEPLCDVGETRGHEVPPTIGGWWIPGSAADGD
jgi:hypothetical protein